MFTEAVTRLETGILDAIKRAKKEGTVGMSKINLKAMTPPIGITFPNPNAWHRAWDEAFDNVTKAKKVKQFEVYGDE